MENEKKPGCFVSVFASLGQLLGALIEIIGKTLRWLYDVLFSGFEFSQVKNKSGFVVFWVTATVFCLVGGVIGSALSETPSNSGSTAYSTVEVTRLVDRLVTATPSLMPRVPPTETTTPSPTLSREDIIRARRLYTVEVISFDATQEFGIEFPYSDYVRLRITNGSEVTLLYLTVLTKRFDAAGQMIGSSRNPSIYIADLAPGESAEVDYYPRGHLPGVVRITVEIESLIDPEVEQFFDELQ